MKKAADILIIGGGIAGCISAMFLCRHYSVCLLDKPGKKNLLWGESLIASSKRIFNELGILNQVEGLSKACCVPSTGIRSYWGTEQPVYSDALRNPEGEGWIVNKLNFVTALQEITQTFPVQFVEGTLTTLTDEPAGWKIEFSDRQGEQQELRAKFIIDASGRTNVLRTKFHLDRIRKDQLICISAAVKTSGVQDAAVIVPDEDGWWYSCALPGKKDTLLLSYYTDADLVEKYLTKDPCFIKRALLSKKEIASKIGNLDLGEYQYLGTRAANTSKLSNIGEKNWIALGDAAMSFDPLSSQGMYNAMAMAAQTSAWIIQSGCIDHPGSGRTADFYHEFYKSACSIWEHYTRHHSLFYGMEYRWSDAVFWKRRQNEEQFFPRSKAQFNDNRYPVL